MQFQRIKHTPNIKILNLIVIIFLIISSTVKSEVFINKEGAMVFFDSSIQRIFFDNIRNYDIEININNTGTLSVIEKINYYLGDTNKSEIHRDLPLRTKEKSFDLNRQHIEMLEINCNGKPVKYVTENTREAGIRYKIKKEKSGNNQCTFKYNVHNAVSKQDEIYQIYFAAIGLDWEIPIEKVNVAIKYTDGKPIERDDVKNLEVYTGDTFDAQDNYTILKDSEILRITNNEPFDIASKLAITLNLKSNKIKISFPEKIKSLYHAEPIVIIAPIVYLLLILYSCITYKLKKSIEIYNKDNYGESKKLPKKNILLIPFYITLVYFIFYTLYRMSNNGVEIGLMIPALFLAFFTIFLPVTVIAIVLIFAGHKKISLIIISPILLYMVAYSFGMVYLVILAGLPIIWGIYRKIFRNEEV